MTLPNSTIEPGQPCVMTSGSASVAGGADVQEVDVEAVDLGAELREAVQPGLARPPVVVLQPVPAQFAGVVQRYPLGPVAHRGRLGPPGPAQPLPEILQLGLRNVDQERGDVVAHPPIMAPRWTPGGQALSILGH